MVYIDSGDEMETVDQAILYSILERGPKRAQAYFFVTVSTVSEPNVQCYQVETFGTEYAFRLLLELGYKCSRPLTYYLKDVFLDMERQGLVSPRRKNYCVSEDSALGSFHYCVLRKRASGAENFSIPELWALRMRNIMQGLAGLREEWYADVNNDVEVEWIPISLEEEAPVEGIRRLMKDTDDSALPDKED